IEGPHVAGIVNTFRAFGSVLGGGIIGQLMVLRSHFHQEMLLDHAGHLMARLPSSHARLDSLAGNLVQQALVLAAADIYRILGLLALLLIPVVLNLQYASATAATPRPAPTGVTS